MASKLPPVKNSAFVFRCVLFAQSDNQIKSNPTLAAGDWKVSIDGGAFANLATLPDVDPDGSVQVKVSLSADEMNGDEIMVTAIDAAGAEWHSAAWVIHTAGQTLDMMDTNIDAALADTAELQTDWADGGRLDLILDARAAQATADDILTDTGTTLPGAIADLPTNAELSAAIAAGDDAVLAAIAAQNDLDAGEVQTAAAAALAAYDPPTKAELDAGLSAADDAVLAAIAALNNLSSAGAQAAAAAALSAYDAATGADLSGLSTLDAAGVRTAVGLAAANLDAQLADIATTAELDAAETVLLAAIDDISGGGSTAADIWSYGARTLTTPAATAGAVADGGDLTVHRGDTMNITLTGLGSIAARTALWFTVKAFVSDPDARALAQITEDDGLAVAFRDEAETPANGSLTVDDEDAGDVTVSLAAVETAQMPAGRALPYDVQMKTASGVTTLAVGNITFREDVTQAVS